MDNLWQRVRSFRRADPSLGRGASGRLFNDLMPEVHFSVVVGQLIVELADLAEGGGRGSGGQGRGAGDAG